MLYSIDGNNGVINTRATEKIIMIGMRIVKIQVKTVENTVNGLISLLQF
jgi:tetrahydromethanopterin S-methyltransferase subunit B